MNEPNPESEHTTEDLNFFKKNRAAIVISLAAGAVLGIVFTIIGIFVSWWFFSASQEFREPVFLLGAKTEIVSAERVAEAPIRVVREDGTEITSDLTAINFTFWNAGQLPIKDDELTKHILTPIKIRFADPDGEIIDFRILNVSRDVIDVKLTRNLEDPDHTIDVSFRVLEKDDGFTGQIMFVGKPSAGFGIAGDIEGVPGGIKGHPQISGWELTLATVTNSETLIFIFLAAFISIGIAWLAGWVSIHMFKMKGRTLDSVTIAVGVIAFIPLFGFAVWGATDLVKDDIELRAAEKVPSSLQI